MTTPPPNVFPARTARVIHGALVAGIVLFLFVSYFFILPKTTNRFDPTISRGALAASLVLCGLSFLFLRAMPRPLPDDSADTFWRTANPFAMRVWAPLEGACLIAVVVYSHGGGFESLIVLLIALALFLLLNPSYLEGRS